MRWTAPGSRTYKLQHRGVNLKKSQDNPLRADPSRERLLVLFFLSPLCDLKMDRSHEISCNFNQIHRKKGLHQI